MSYPHSRPETIADGIIHAAGLAFALPATVMLMARPPAHPVETALYCATLVASLLASAVYHLSPVVRSRAWLGRVDHAMIYFKIAGTYTPLVAVIGTRFAYGILALVWGLALIGAVAKLRGWAADARGSLALYLAMGWLSVLLVSSMISTLPAHATALVIAGGLVYSLGTIIYARSAMPYQNAIWHSFVLIASVCFFVAISLSV